MLICGRSSSGACVCIFQVPCPDIGMARMQLAATLQQGVLKATFDVELAAKWLLLALHVGIVLLALYGSNCLSAYNKACAYGLSMAMQQCPCADGTCLPKPICIYLRLRLGTLNLQVELGRWQDPRSRDQRFCRRCS